MEILYRKKAGRVQMDGIFSSSCDTSNLDRLLILIYCGGNINEEYIFLQSLFRELISSESENLT